ncbi:biliverdin-producing heme oxygenase [Thiocystis violacea]|uniref:biliverdin-producing heme oxygenase n=1 Tax=Thiocystis violacea TaxID=13725 RepID=UPI0019048BFA|nr:biliverdin-producing heme oxygenase [Thiocystis violacea]MBK1716163.1 biliverdin-producing heme oxygenase [Thiocystis violacea]
MQDLGHPSTPSSPIQIDLAIALRQATAEAHAAVERLPMMCRLTSESVTREDYRDYLQTLAAIYAPLEPSLYARLDNGLREALGVRPKLPALRHDLEEQGGVWLTHTPETTPWLDCPDGVSAAVGGLYVLEGATLGGRTIARQLRRILGDGLGSASFLDFHGTDTSAAWKQFSGGLNALVARGILAPEAVIAGALAVFGHVHRRLEQADPAGAHPASPGPGDH